MAHARSPTEGLAAKAKALLILSLVLPASLYVVLATRLIGAHVGYQMDEALYVESAVFVLRGTPDAASWKASHGRRWPLMIIPYVGTTKAFVALPLFAIFGISAEVARFSGVLLGTLGLCGLVALIGSRASPAAGMIVGVLLAMHPSYLDFTVFDNGGVSVWMAAAGLGALALANYLHRRSRLSALLLGVAAGLGVWARANLLWLIASVIVAALLAFGRRAIPARRHITAMMIGAFCGALPLTIYEVGSRLATLRLISSARQPVSIERILERLRALAELAISDGEQRGIWAGPPLPLWQVAVGAALLVAVVMSIFIRIRSNDPELSRWRRAFGITAVTLTGIMLISGLGIAPHHLLAALPLALAALAILSVEVVSRSRFARPLLATLAIGLVLLWSSWDVRIDRGLRRSQGKGFWSSAIDEVREHFQSHPAAPGRLKILNWGFQNNIYVGSGGSVYGSELFWGATEARSSRGISWGAEIRDGGSFLLFLFPTGPPSLDAAANGFLEALKNYRGLRRETRFPDRSGAPVALLVEITPTQ